MIDRECCGGKTAYRSDFFSLSIKWLIIQSCRFYARTSVRVICVLEIADCPPNTYAFCPWAAGKVARSTHVLGGGAIAERD